MDAETLRTFLTVARTRSISKAATQLFATQPAVSQRIKRLENELGFPVLERSWRGAELTVQGRHILPTMIEYLMSLETARTLLLSDSDAPAISSIAGWHAGPELIGYDDWLLGRHQEQLMHRLDAAGVEANITASSAPKINSLITHAICQLGIQYAPEAPQNGAVTSYVLWNEPLCLVYPAQDTPPGGFSKEHLHDYFSTRSFILMEEPIYTLHSTVTERFFEQIRPGPIKVVDNVDVMATLAGIVGNATIVPAGLVARRRSFSEDRVRSHVLSDSLGTIPVRLDINNYTLTPTVEAIVELIQDWAMTVPPDIDSAFMTRDDSAT